MSSKRLESIREKYRNGVPKSEINAFCNSEHEVSRLIDSVIRGTDEGI